MIQMLQQHILGGAYALQLIPEPFLIEQLADLEADLRVFIRIKRRDAGFGGAEGLSAQSLLLILVEQDVIGHHHLRPVGHQDLRSGHASVRDGSDLVHQNRNIKRHAVSDDAGGMSVKYAGRKRMQRELSVIVHDRVSRVRSSLKTDDDIGLTGKHIRDLALSFVSPVCSNNRFYHFYLFSCRRRAAAKL